MKRIGWNEKISPVKVEEKKEKGGGKKEKNKKGNLTNRTQKQAQEGNLDAS